MEQTFDYKRYALKNLFEKVLKANDKCPRFSLMITPTGLSVMFQENGDKRYIGSVVNLRKESARNYIEAIEAEIDEILKDMEF